ncbi:unnamed protein product [Cochlearia groenlandica]
MNGLSHHLRASSLPCLIRVYGGINSLHRFSSQSDGFSGRFGEQRPFPGDSEKNSELPNSGGSVSSSYKSFSDTKPGTGRGNGSSTFKSFAEMRSGLTNNTGRDGFGSSAPNAPPTFRNPLRSPRLPDQFGLMNLGLSNEGGSGVSSSPSYQKFAETSILKDDLRSGGTSKDLEFVKDAIVEDEGRRNLGIFSPFHRPNIETNADIIHIKLLRNNTFVTVTDSKGNVKCKATSGSLPDLKGGRKMTNYTADATAENIGRRAKAMGLKSVVVKVNGFTHFKKKRNAVIAFRNGYSNSRTDQNPIVYIEDTTRKAHNGCRLPRKRRV